MSENREAPEVKVSLERAARLLDGQITMGDFVGLSKTDLYNIAQLGYQLLSSGQLAEAKRIYKGLAAADPFDSTFQCHLAAIHHRLGERDEAIERYTEALRFNPRNGDALVGRGEVYLQSGRLEDALNDLKAAIEADPNGRNLSTLRARAIIVALNNSANEAAQSHQQKPVASGSA